MFFILKFSLVRFYDDFILDTQLSVYFTVFTQTQYFAQLRNCIQLNVRGEISLVLKNYLKLLKSTVIVSFYKFIYR